MQDLNFHSPVSSSCSPWPIKAVTSEWTNQRKSPVLQSCSTENTQEGSISIAILGILQC